MFGFFGKYRKKDIEKKKNSDEQQQQQADQEDINIKKVKQSKCIQAQNNEDNQFKDNQFLQNQQQQDLKVVPNFKGQQIQPQTQYKGNIQGTLNYHILRMIFSYLDGFGLVQAKQTCQYFNFLIKFKSYQEGSNEEVKVQDNQIQKYLEVDLNKIKEQNLIAVKVIVTSKDQGWASAKYSSSWVTLKLINAEKDQLDHCYDSENLDEVNIVENYRNKYFVTSTIIISSFHNKNPKLSQFLKHLKEGNYEKLALVMKCQYPGWECLIQSASIEFIVLEKD